MNTSTGLPGLSPTSAARPRLLAVFAHPDDESYGPGGTLALYSWMGAAVRLVCTTGGEAGVVDEDFLQKYGSVRATRTAELHCATRNLGIDHVYLFDYRDSGMEGAPTNQHPDALYTASLDEVTARITRIMRAFQPHVVITFDPIGGYRHPDHIITHQATVQAFRNASDPQYLCRADDGIDGDDGAALPPYQPQKLYYAVIPRTFLKWYVRAMPLFGQDPTRFGRNQDIDLTKLANDDYPIHARIDYRVVREQRAAAVECHASQNRNPTVTRSLIGLLTRTLAGGETFMRAFPPPLPGLHENDLFAGVRLE